MFDNGEGWILGETDLLRYRQGDWEEVTLPHKEVGFLTMGMLGPEEGWVISTKGMLHYRDGVWETFEMFLPAMSAMLMIDEHEGWAVGVGGILHYTRSP